MLNEYCNMEQLECRDTSLKELPTRESKLKRNKDRRDSPTVPPIRLRLKSNSSPVHEPEMERSYSDRSVSSSPDFCTQNISPTMTYHCYSKHSLRVDSAPSSPSLPTELNNNVLCEVPFSSRLNPEGAAYVSCDDSYDEPLDMSTKRSHEAVTSSEVTSAYSQQHRPSVITCASALLKAQCNLTDVAHNLCTTPLHSDSNSNDSKEALNTNGDDNCYPCRGPDEIRQGHRREVVSGSCDPVIDEHFRRSLGKDYQQIFSKSSTNSVSITVDDHFAKALGDTWLQLQQSKSVEPASSESPSALQQPQQQTQFLQHSPEMVST